MRAAEKTETAGPTPEQLLRMVEAELAGRRAQRSGGSRNRATVLVAGILFIVVAAGVALLALDHMIGELRADGAAAPDAGTQEAGNF